MRRPFTLLALGLVVFATALATATAPAPAGAATIPDRMLRLARAELAKGVREIPDGSNDSPDIARYRTAFPWRMPIAAWCGYFVSYIAKQAGVPLGEQGQGIGAVEEIRKWAVRTGRWKTSRPRPGDLWIKRNRGHVGIVERVVPGGIVSLDGNYMNRVARSQRRRSDVLGFVRLAVGNRPYGHDLPPPEPDWRR